MKTIYAVNAGDYSDYRVIALFSTEQKAIEYMKTVKNDSYNDIDKYELDPPTVSLLSHGYSVWCINMLRDGDIERVIRTENDHYDVENAPDHSVWERSKAGAYQGTGKPDILTSKVWAKTQKQAIKIVNEKRIQMIAAGEW